MTQFSSTDYSPVARLLHWLIAALILTQFVLAKLAEAAEHSDRLVFQLGLLANHKSLGITILAFAIVRLMWRVFHRPPALPQSLARWQQKLSHISHFLLYALLFAIPVSGWIIASASAYGFSWFNLIELPRLVSQNTDLEHRAKDIHEFLSNLLLILVSVHILAALIHHFYYRDTILKRMSSKFMLGVFLSAPVFLLFFLIPDSPSNASKRATSKQATTSDSTERSAVDETLLAIPSWNIDYSRSYIRFTGTQAGASFSGDWQDWNATIKIDPEVTRGYIDVNILINSVNSNDSERDETIKAADWFDAAAYPKAHFQLTEIALTDNGKMTGSARLSIKSHTVETPFTFETRTNNAQKTLTGSARLDRFDYDLGLGEWQDTDWIGQYVDVNVYVVTQ